MYWPLVRCEIDSLAQRHIIMVTNSLFSLTSIYLGQRPVILTQTDQTLTMKILRSSEGTLFGIFSEDGRNKCLPIHRLPRVSLELLSNAKDSLQKTKFLWDGQTLSPSFGFLMGGAPDQTPIIPTNESSETAEKVNPLHVKTFGDLRDYGAQLTVQEGVETLSIDFRLDANGTQHDNSTQENVLKVIANLLVIEKKAPSTISISHSAALTLDSLLPLLHEELTRLTIVDCSNLKTIETNKLIGTGRLHLPTLQKLHLEACDGLVSIQINAPNLDLLKIPNNSKLVQVRISAKLVTVIERARSQSIKFELPAFEDPDKKLSSPACLEFAKHIEAFAKHSQGNRIENLGLIAWYHLKAYFKKTSFEGDVGKHFFRLDINDLECEHRIDDVGIKYLLSALRGSPLTSLSLNGNKIENVGVKRICRFLNEKESRLKALSLSDNLIGDDEAIELSSSIREETLYSLNLSGTHIGTKGVQALASILKYLHSLNLSGNMIGPDGTEALMSASIHPDSKLGMLDVSHNPIGDKDAEIIASYLEKGSSIDQLSLNNTQITQIGAKTIIQALSKSRLTHINLKNNPLGNGWLFSLAGVLDEPFSMNRKPTESGWETVIHSIKNKEGEPIKVFL